MSKKQEAYGRLMSQIASLEGRLPGSVPCLGDKRVDWTSEVYRDQQRAALACQDCPLIRACLRYSRKHDERAGVWGGRVPRSHTKPAEPKPRQQELFGAEP